MADWAIGDLHGCADEFDALLELIHFDSTHDTLWLTGDLINRGPKCLQTLRRVHALAQVMGERMAVVLGNHDLHLLACWSGVRQPKKSDTLNTILAAPDASILCEWLRRQPLIHTDGNHVLVHAGLHPRLTWAQNYALAQQLHHALLAPEFSTALQQVYANTVHDCTREMTAPETLAFAAATLTRMRCLNPDMSLNTSEKGSPCSLPPGVTPWFEHLESNYANWQIHTGHWAALGYGLQGVVVALDGGCVWGGELVAVRRDAPHLPYKIPRQLVNQSSES